MAKVTSKSILMDAEIKNGLEEKVDKLLAVAKLSQYSVEKEKGIVVTLQNKPPLIQGRIHQQREIET